MDPTVIKKILQFKNNQILWVEDIVAKETKIKIFINDEEIISLSATPLHIKELVTGFFLTENIIKGNWCPQEMEIIEDKEEIKVKVYSDGSLDLTGKIIPSGCMASYSFLRNIPQKYEDNFKIDIENLFNLFKEFQKNSELYKTTGCIHYCALADNKEIFFLAEDIGRHNAVDKVIGYAFLNKIPLENKIILTSGRISFEMVLKVGNFKVPIIVSRAAPTSLAIELAEKIGLTVIGFLRGNRFNIYTYPYRVII